MTRAKSTKRKRGCIKILCIQLQQLLELRFDSIFAHIANIQDIEYSCLRKYSFKIECVLCTQYSIDYMLCTSQVLCRCTICSAIVSPQEPFSKMFCPTEKYNGACHTTFYCSCVIFKIKRTADFNTDFIYQILQAMITSFCEEFKGSNNLLATIRQPLLTGATTPQRTIQKRYSGSMEQPGKPSNSLVAKSGK